MLGISHALSDFYTKMFRVCVLNSFLSKYVLYCAENCFYDLAYAYVRTN